MFSFFQYHIESGFIEGRVDVNEEEQLAAYARDGYDFLLADRAFSADLYVQDGVLTKREVFPMVLTTLSAALGEQIEVKGLPVDSFVRINHGIPAKTTKGAFGITKASPGKVTVEFAGKYWSKNTYWALIWDEIDNLRTSANLAIDQGAEIARGVSTTEGAGQAMTYIRKAEAARLFVAGAELTEAQMSRLTDEAERTGATLEQAAAKIIEKADEWEARDAQIDSIRLAAKKAVAEATTGREIDRIVKKVVWPS